CMYSMFSTPLIDSSSGAATVSASTLGLAPGYWARTTTEGGTTSGYSEMGSLKTAIAPASVIRTEITPAKIGRSMKNLEIFMLAPFRKRWRRHWPWHGNPRRRRRAEECRGDARPAARPDLRGAHVAGR